MCPGLGVKKIIIGIFLQGHSDLIRIFIPDLIADDASWIQ